MIRSDSDLSPSLTSRLYWPLPLPLPSPMLAYAYLPPPDTWMCLTFSQ